MTQILPAWVIPLTAGLLAAAPDYPFSQGRFFFGWRPIHVSPLGIAPFFSNAGYILKSETPFDAAACAIGVGGWLLSGLNTSGGSPSPAR